MKILRIMLVMLAACVIMSPIAASSAHLDALRAKAARLKPHVRPGYKDIAYQNLMNRIAREELALGGSRMGVMPSSANRMGRSRRFLNWLNRHRLETALALAGLGVGTAYGAGWMNNKSATPWSDRNQYGRWVNPYAWGTATGQYFATPTPPAPPAEEEEGLQGS